MADDEPPAKASRLGPVFFEAAGLNDTQEVRSGSSSSNRPDIPNAPPTDLDSLAALSAGLGVTYANIDAISMAGAGLYDFPALSSPGSYATVAHVSELKAGMTVWIYQGVYWESPPEFVAETTADGTVIGDPKRAELLAVYQCLDNTTGASPRLQCVVTHDKVPTRANMTATRHLFIGNVDGVEALRQLNLAVPLPLISNSVSRSLAHGPRSKGDWSQGAWLEAGDLTTLATPLGHESSVNYAPPDRGIRVDTAATDELKQQLGLVLRTTLFSKPAYRAIMGTMNSISNAEVAAAMRIRMDEHLKQSIVLSDKYFFPFITAKFDNLAGPTTKSVSTTVSLAQALEKPETYDDLDA